MSELDISTFTKFVVNKLTEIESNIVLDNPDDEEEFPIGVVNMPMQSIIKVENNTPIYIRFSINVEWWTNSKYDSMDYFQKTNELLREYNFIPIGSPTDMYDAVTRKYRFGSRYEVNYNGLTNSFERVK